MKGKFLNYLFWLVIAAAFIGPGTVTTAASAGASFQYQLVWAMVFSTMACLVLQEAAARIAIVTGASLGQAIRNYFKADRLVWLIGGAILLGCLAYEAGNILGAISGVALILTGLPVWVFTLSIGVIAFGVLYGGKAKTVANILGLLVAVMGLAFLIAAFSAPIDGFTLLMGGLIPSMPNDGLVISLGLIGTTIVPYNIFLGSSLAEGQSIKQMRSGLSTSVILGGVISICVIIVGAQLKTEFSFSALYTHLLRENGQIMAWLFAIGLFAAGFTSTITASMAGALTIKSVAKNGGKWHDKSKQYRGLWATILLVGVLVGISGLKPIPVIILAQAANGLILPFLTFAIWLIINSPMMRSEKNGRAANAFMAVTLFVSTILGLLNVVKATYSALGQAFLLNQMQLAVLSLLSLALVVYAVLRIRRKSNI